MEWSFEEYVLTDDNEKIDVDAVHRMLSGSYWAADRTRETIEKSIRGSFCLSLFRNGEQVGFLRAVTDRVTFAWICDVIIREDVRGRGLGKRLVECILSHPELEGVNLALATRDAHGLYERYGFARSEAMRKPSNT